MGGKKSDASFAFRTFVRSGSSASSHQRKSTRLMSIISRGQANVDNEKKKQHTVRWRSPNEQGDDDRFFEVEDGELLRTACLRRGRVTPHNGNSRLINCRGLGTCGTCAVEIEAADESNVPPTTIEPPQRNNRENLRLNFPPHGSADQSPLLRLACQCAVRGDIVVTKRAGFWGQDEKEMVAPETYKTYFGELEFVMDSRSPTDDKSK